MIEFKEGRYVAAMWFVAFPDYGDMLATLYTDDPFVDGKALPWVVVQRARVYDKEDPGNDPFSGKDTKQIQMAHKCCTELEAIKDITNALEKVYSEALAAGLAAEKPVMIPVFSSNPKDIVSIIEQGCYPFMHMKQLSPKEAKQYEADSMA